MFKFKLSRMLFKNEKFSETTEPLGIETPKTFYFKIVFETFNEATS